MESRLRQKLAQFPALKLFFKIFIDLGRADFFQFRNSLNGWIMTLGCHWQQLVRSRKEVVCNICDWHGYRFYPHVTKSRVIPDEKCPGCHSIPRYRLIQHFLIHELDFYQQQLSVLEVGPNRSLQYLLQQKENFDYISIDLYSPQAMLTMDVSDLKFEDKKFDFIFCISVMQYVKDDLKGFKEMFRVLKPGGRLLFASAVDTRKEKTVTYATPAATQSYVLRTYGQDVLQLIKKAGFIVNVYQPANEIENSLRKKYGMSADIIYLLTRES